MTFEMKDMLGKTFTEIKNLKKSVVFMESNGDGFLFWHDQNCCERVTVEDVCGDLLDLVGSPLLMADEVVSHENPFYSDAYQDKSFTWTFYKFATVKGYVTIRWYGESNGHYSERVDKRRTKKDKN